MLSQEEILRGVKEFGPWFHQMDLGHGIRTREIYPAPGPQPIDHPLSRWERLRGHLPGDLSSMRILDIGCADGFFSIEAARRGADRVLSLDPWKPAVQRCAFAARVLGLPAVDPQQATIYDLGPEYGSFDLVLMLAVLYHLEHPFLALQKVSQVTDVVYLESLTVDDRQESYLFLKEPDQQSHFIPKWIPTKRCLEDMLRWTGFTEFEELDDLGDKRSLYLARRTPRRVLPDF